MGGSNSAPTRNAIENRGLVDSAILTNCVVVFSTTSCKFCDKAKTVLTNLGIRFKVIELDLEGKNSFKYSKELESKTGARTVPQIFVNGDYIGGYSEMERLKDTGRFMELVHQCATARQSILLEDQCSFRAQKSMMTAMLSQLQKGHFSGVLP